MENQRHPAKSKIPLQSAALLGREEDRRPRHHTAWSEQPGGRRMDRPFERTLRDPRYAGSVQDRACIFARLHPSDELGRHGVGGHDETKCARDASGVVMRLQTFTAFGFGFGMGVLSLAAGLWWTRRIAPQTPQMDVPDAHAPAPSPVQAPVESRPPDRLVMPVAGVDPSKLRSNFDEIRGGHQHEALDIMAPRGTPVMAV